MIRPAGLPSPPHYNPFIFSWSRDNSDRPDELEVVLFVLSHVLDSWQGHGF